MSATGQTPYGFTGQFTQAGHPIYAMNTPDQPTPANTGHGHVYPRSDGIRARCGGPSMCKECARDLAKFNAVRVQPTPDLAPTPRTNGAVIVLPTYFKLECVSTDFARTLERELSAAKAECERLRHDVSRKISVCDQACLEAKRLREENAVFRAAQKICEDCDAPTNAELARLRAEMERLTECRRIDQQSAKNQAARAEAALSEARKEIKVLRWWGNKDCTAMADAALKGIIP